LCYHDALDFPNARLAYLESFTLRQRADRATPAAPLPPAPHPLRLGWPEPKTLDPGFVVSVIARCVVDQLFCGLLDLSPELGIVPDVARSWEVFDGGRRYVFRLRNDVCWSDGAALTAHDFAYAWQRVLDRRPGSKSASLLFIVKGVAAYHQADGASPDQLGVRARDAETLEVELERPAGYFLHLLTCPTTFAVPQHVIAAHGAAWTQLEHIVTSGPFRLASYEPGKTMTLRRNPAYRGPFTGNVERVELDLAVPWVEGARLEKYELDGLDVGAAYDLPRVARQVALQRHADEYTTSPMLWIDFIGFDVRRPPFDDVRVRRAFVLATNREELATSSGKARSCRPPAVTCRPTCPVIRQASHCPMTRTRPAGCWPTPATRRAVIAVSHPCGPTWAASAWKSASICVSVGGITWAPKSPGSRRSNRDSTPIFLSQPGSPTSPMRTAFWATTTLTVAPAGRMRRTRAWWPKLAACWIKRSGRRFMRAPIGG